MAEEIQKKKISELPSAVYLSDEDVMPVVQGSGSSEATKKADIGLVGSTVAESKTFSNLDTTSKTLVGAINEVNSSLGNVPSADEISYDNTSSGLSASDVQGAIDEIAQGGSGGSTVTVTQIQATGTKIATITVDSVDTDLYAPQGGGSGGHTILDDEGTSLTQRDDLQFKGAYSEDDSTNEKTVVNVARTMTLAEFEQLTEAEKAGFINVADETSGSDDKFQPVIYSEEEREIGVWTDGKPLYQKTYEIDVSTLVAVSDWTTIDSTINGETMAGMEISVKNKTDYSSRFIAFRTDYVDPIPRFTIIQGAFKYFTDSSTFPYNNYVWTITIRYTKSTDQAGSGQWTPQGVPTVHYSENEQVIGTWIDGSTLYEKTIDFGALPNNTTKSVNHGIINLDKVAFLNGIAYKSGDIIPIPFSHSGNVSNQPQLSIGNTTVNIRTANDQSDRTGYITVRYTKSST